MRKGMLGRHINTWLFHSRHICSRANSELPFNQLLERAQSCEASRRAAVARLLAWVEPSQGPVGAPSSPTPGDTPSGHTGAAARSEEGVGAEAAATLAGANELLRLCAGQGAVDDAIQVLASLERRGLKPDADTLAQLYDVFSYFPKPMS